MATNKESSSGLWFLIGAVIVAVAAIVWYLNSGGSAPAGGETGTNVTVEAPAATSSTTTTAPAATTDAAPAATTTTTTAPAATADTAPAAATTTTTTAPSN